MQKRRYLNYKMELPLHELLLGHRNGMFSMQCEGGRKREEKKKRYGEINNDIWKS
jgi:hypothetical protein